ncbi:Serine/threonine-protein phosphatase 1 [Halomonadaceae bacterium LMG 33818]|uniref:metallophosphoesterase n=1 Tax=Cernens ardua TaxID=3402176 RepID=UPI003EDBECD0
MTVFHLEENTKGRDFVCGDVHGHLDTLKAELSRWQFDTTKDRLLMVGDLIDRGPHSRETLALVFEPWVIACRGNHEMEALHAAKGVRGRSFDNWISQGGEWFLQESEEAISIFIQSAVARMPWAIEVTVKGKRIGIVHAEPTSDWQHMACADTETLVWRRERIYQKNATPVSGIDHVLVGHTPVHAAGSLGNVHWIDTGCYETGALFVAPLNQLVEQLPFEKVPIPLD